MPDTPTARLQLYKSASDGSEDVSYTQDIGQNWDRVDLAVGALACTSSTRPSSPWNGQLIRETNTGRLWVSNGSAPASGSWSEICTPGTAQTFTGAVTASGGLALRGATSTTTVVSSALAADTQQRLVMDTSGKLTWGSGSAAGDTNLYRSAANVLKTDDSLTVAGDLSVSGVGQMLFARKASDTARTTTTYSDDPDLTLNVVAGAVYQLEARLYIRTSSTGVAGFGMKFTSPASTGGWWDSLGLTTTATTSTDNNRVAVTAFDTTNRLFGGTSGGNIPVYVSGIVRPTASGAFTVNWAMDTGPGTMTLVTDSFMKLLRVA